VIHSKKIVRDDGTRIAIEVELFEARGSMNWRVCVYLLEDFEDHGSHGYWRNVYSVSDALRLQESDRQKFMIDCILRVVTLKEIYDAKMELLEMIKPTLGEI
jgi:hypothetical protein